MDNLTGRGRVKATKKVNKNIDAMTLKKTNR